MSEHCDTGDNDAFKGLLILMRLIWAPLLWPILAANAAGFAWCVASAF